MSNDVTRRDLLRASAAAAVGLALGAPTTAAAEHRPPKSPNARIRFAIVGAGGKGWSDAEDAARHGDIVAICDVDANNRSKSMMQYPLAATFSDFRVMLDRMHGDLDAVVVSTPDHTHAPAAAMAMHYGKHVFCQKPLTRTLFEARRLAQLARSKKLATQMGNQGTAQPELRRVAACIRSGAFGPVRAVHCWTDRAGNWWRQGVPRGETRRIPAHVDWESWLGPSPYRPYAEHYHPFSWRGWWDFGSGALGDMGCHIMNLAFMALDLRDPVAVQAKTSGHNRDSFPAWSIVTYEFASRGTRPPLTLTWYDGGQRPDPALAPGVTLAENGSLFVCERATIYSPNEYGGNAQIIGDGQWPDVQVEESPGHFAEFVRAIEGGPPAKSNFPDYAGPLTETVLLGNLAIWADGPRLEWDPGAMRVKGASELDPLIRPQYREGWSL